MERYDAILIPGGGVRAGGELPPWVKQRFERALAYDTRYIICLSAGTTHKAPPLDADGFPFFESIAGARYLLNAGFPAEKILTETCSYDTIGNAFFARLIHTDPLGLQRIRVITSQFHFERVEVVFNWVFGMDKNNLGYDLHFEAVPNVGLPPEVLDARIEKERAGILHIRKLAQTIGTLSELHQWLFTRHDAYRPNSKILGQSGLFLSSY